DVYGNPTQITIANTALKFNKTLSLAADGVFIRNDDCEIGLLPLLEKQNTLIAENEINMVVWGYNSRAMKVISAPDDKTQTSAELYLKKLVDGDLSVIGENALFEGIRVQTGQGANSIGIQPMIENQQYLKASLNNELGISSNFNLKRERLVTAEVEQGDEGLFPFVYNMLENRLNAVALLNEKYELEIDVDFGSVWADKQKELVDNNPENNDETLATATTPEPDNNPESDSGEEANQEQEQTGADNAEQTSDETLDVDGDGDGERGLSPDSETDPETEVEPEPLIVDPENPTQEDE
ncbi:UNVERIFIED_CONTAM: hypothetical protein RF648_18510, partial [Kocuria sp. CPCC 205274]